MPYNFQRFAVNKDDGELNNLVRVRADILLAGRLKINNADKIERAASNKRHCHPTTNKLETSVCGLKPSMAMEGGFFCHAIEFDSQARCSPAQLVLDTNYKLDMSTQLPLAKVAL